MKKLWLSIAMLAALAGGAHAQDAYPSRPITIVAPFPPGGPTDTISRVMADHLKTTLGQSIVVEN